MIFKIWHSMLGMQKYDLAWYEADIADEFAEYEEAKGFIERWSELSDISYTYTHAKWSGHKGFRLPISFAKFIFGSVYMFPKYTLRWLFFRRAGKKSGANEVVREVRNPVKVSKLNEIARKYEVDEIRFVSVCESQLHWWPLLK